MDEISEEYPRSMKFVNDIVRCGEIREKGEASLEKWRCALERREMKARWRKTKFTVHASKWEGGRYV